MSTAMKEATDIHSCSPYCDRPECIKAQRDELREAIAKKDAALDACIEAMEMAMAGLRWYRGMHPEDVDESDAVADSDIDAAIQQAKEARK